MFNKREWLVIYVDECGDRQIMPFYTFESANEWFINIRKQGTCVIGITTISFYNHYIEQIIF